MLLRRTTVFPLLMLVVGAAAVACGDDDDGVDVTPTADAGPGVDSSRPDAGGSDGATGSDASTGAPKITTASIAPVVAGKAVATVQLTASGAPPITWAVTAGALPAGMTLSPTGAYTGTPTATGSFSFTVTATNALGSDSKAFTQVVSAPVPDAVLLLADNKIAAFATAFPAGASAPVAVTGLTAGDLLGTIDRRPLNGYLYALAFNATSQAVTLYALNPVTATAVAVGAPGTFDTPITGLAFGTDFNPLVDRVRVVSSTGENFRMNPNTGAVVDANAGAAGVQKDGTINGGTAVTAFETAYTNNAINAAFTTQYTISGASLFVQNPPNDGKLTLPQTLMTVETVFGFDIPTGVTVTANNTAVAAGSGFAAIKSTGQAATQFASINLPNGQLNVVGAFPFNGVTGLALDTADEIPVIGLSSDGLTLIRFSSATPATTVPTAAITGINAGEQLVGIDFRPATGQLYGLGVSALTNTGTLYLLDPQTGAATMVGTGAMITFVDQLAVPTDLPPASAGYGFNFNPSVDRIRVTTGTGLNFRINPITGAPVDGNNGGAADSVPGTNPDGPIVAGGLTGVAYTNDAPATGATSITTEYGINSATGKLHIVSVPNVGTVLPGVDIKLNGAALAFGAVSGFDIMQTVTTAAANTAVTAGTAYAALSVGAATSLYKIDLVTGVATLVAPIGAGTAGIAGIAVGR